MCTWVKNGYRGGDVFGCRSLGEVGGKDIFLYKRKCFLLPNKKIIISVICYLLHFFSLIEEATCTVKKAKKRGYRVGWIKDFL